MEVLHLLSFCLCMLVVAQLSDAYAVAKEIQAEKRDATNVNKAVAKNDDALETDIDAIIGYDIEHPKLIEELDDFIHSLAKKVSDASTSAAVNAAPEIPLSRIFDSGKKKVSDEKEDEEFYRELVERKRNAVQEKKSLGFGNGPDISMQELDNALGMLLNYYVSGNDQYGRKRSTEDISDTENTDRRFELMAAKRRGIAERRYGKDGKRSSDSDGNRDGDRGDLNLPRGFGRRYGRRDSDVMMAARRDMRNERRAVDLSKLSKEEKKKMLSNLLAKINRNGRR